MDKGHNDHCRYPGVIVDLAARLTRLSAATDRVVSDSGGKAEDDDALSRRVLRAIAMSATIRSNRRAANSLPGDVEDAEEAAMLARAQNMLRAVLESKRTPCPPTVPN